MTKILLALASSLFASLASANPVTIDLDGITAGTDVSYAFSGVTLRHLSVIQDVNGNGLLVEDNVYAKECPTTSDPKSMCSALGSGYFGSFVADSSVSINCITGSPYPCRRSPHRFLDVRFDFAVRDVAIDATHYSDWPQAWAFDAAGNRLQVTTRITWHKQTGPGWPGNNFGHQTLTVTPVSGQISRVIFSGQGGYVLLDKITYTIP